MKGSCWENGQLAKQVQLFRVY